MRTDISGRSTTKPGEEHWEEFYLKGLSGSRVQYDYRTPEGRLFSTIAVSLERAREKRDQWLERNSAEYPETLPGIPEPEFSKAYPGEWIPEDSAELGLQDPPSDPRIFNRKLANGSYRSLREFFGIPGDSAESRGEP